MKKQINIALSCFDIDLYSETFIKAHRERLKGNIFTYYGGFLPSKLFPNGALPLGNKLSRLCRRLYGRIFLHRELYDYQVALRKSLLNNAIDVFFAEYGQTGVWCLDVCRDLKIPMIVHFHGADASQEDVLNEYSDRYPELFSYASSIVAVSEKMRIDLINLGAPTEKVVITRCAPNDRFFSLNPTLDKPHFLQIGRLIELKAPLDTIQAFALVKEKHPDAQLTICGQGQLTNDCKEMIDKLGLADRINLPGAVAPDNIAEYIENSIALIHPSVTVGKNRTEGGCSVAILEAMAAGLPVIGTESGGIPDVVEHGKNGFLATEHDIEAIAGYMTQLLDNSETARLMGAYGKKLAEDKYSMRNHIGVLNNLIEQALNNQ